MGRWRADFDPGRLAALETAPVGQRLRESSRSLHAVVAGHR